MHIVTAARILGLPPLSPALTAAPWPGCFLRPVQQQFRPRAADGPLPAVGRESLDTLETYHHADAFAVFIIRERDEPNAPLVPDFLQNGAPSQSPHPHRTPVLVG